MVVNYASSKAGADAVVAARAAFAGWSGKSAFNRSQILYRIAEMIEGRKAQFTEELVAQGITAKAAETEVLQSIDRIVHYAGWCDKYSQLFSSVNPVASSHFNFSVPDKLVRSVMTFIVIANRYEVNEFTVHKSELPVTKNILF